MPSVVVAPVVDVPVAVVPVVGVSEVVVVGVVVPEVELVSVATSVELVGLVVESVVVAALETPGIRNRDALLKAIAIARSVYLIFEDIVLFV